MDRAISSQLHVFTEKDMQSDYCLRVNRALSFLHIAEKIQGGYNYMKLFLLVFRYRIPFCYLMYVIKSSSFYTYVCI